MMIIAAVAVTAIAANAGQSITNCFGGTSKGCDAIGFKLTASGKTVQTLETKSGDEYKTVKALKISKGALVMPQMDAPDAPTNCCTDTAILMAQVVIGKDKYYVAEDAPLLKWSIFGKDFETAINGEMKPGASKTLETDLGFQVAGGVIYDADGDDTGLTYDITAVAFGTMKYAMSKAKENNNCNGDDQLECIPVLTWKTYNGWFAGQRDVTSYSFACATCECGDTDLVGGTWKAVYQKSWTTVKKAAVATFGAALAGELIEDEDDGE